MFVRRLTMEPLERRLLLAVDNFVNVGLRGGWLDINGNDADNQILVENVGENHFRVVGRDGTEVRAVGDVDPQNVGPIRRGIRANLGSGDDKLILIGNVPGNVSINMGDGNDSVTFGFDPDDPPDDLNDGNGRYFITGRTTVDLGRSGGSEGQVNENTFVSFNTDFDRDVTIRARDLSDDESMVHVGIANADVGGRLNITMGNTDNSVGLLNVQVARDVNIRSANAPRGEEGEVEIGIEDTEIGGRLRITTGNTDDSIGLSNVQVARDVNIRTGDGKDSVIISASEIRGRLTVDIGRGRTDCDDPPANRIEVSDTTVARDVSFRARDNVVAENYDWYAHDVDVSRSSIGGRLNVNLGRGGSSVGLANVDISRNVSIRTGHGDDLIDIGLSDQNGAERNTFGGNLNVRTGNGDHMVSVTNSNVARALAISGGHGHNFVAVAAVDVQGGNVSIRTGREDDLIVIADLAAERNVTINTGNATVWEEDQLGGDAVLLTDATVVGNLSITTGNGHDTIGIGVGDGDAVDEALQELLEIIDGLGLDSLSELIDLDEVDVRGRTRVGTGSGEDTLAIGNSTFFNNISINTGAGVDDCFIVDSNFHGNVSVQMGPGDDYLWVENNTVTGRSVRLDGGPGEDWLDGVDDNDIGHTTRLTIRNFQPEVNFP